MTYDTHLFIEIIESIKGITFLREETTAGVRARFYEGLSGRLVVLECSDEDIEENQGKGCLIQLGLDYLIPSLFPPEKKHPLQEVGEILKDDEENIETSD